MPGWRTTTASGRQGRRIHSGQSGRVVGVPAGWLNRTRPEAWAIHRPAHSTGYRSLRCRSEIEPKSSNSSPVLTMQRRVSIGQFLGISPLRMSQPAALAEKAGRMIRPGPATKHGRCGRRAGPPGGDAPRSSDPRPGGDDRGRLSIRRPCTSRAAGVPRSKRVRIERRPRDFDRDSLVARRDLLRWYAASRADVADRPQSDDMGVATRPGRRRRPVE